jgi:hypothetical protein
VTWLADVVLAALALEAVVLLLFGKRWQIGRVETLSALAPGTALVLALRFALEGRGAAAIGGALLLAMAAHVNDMLGRRRRSLRLRP